MDLTLLNLLKVKFHQLNSGYIIYMIVIFYGVRAIVQANFRMRFPEGGIWDFPGIPSLTVPYGLTRDFYFSGHCGFLTMNAYIMFRDGRKRTFALLCGAIFYVGFVLVLFRIHYSIDIPIGIFAGLYTGILLEKISFVLDKIFLKMVCASYWRKKITSALKPSRKQDDSRLKK